MSDLRAAAMAFHEGRLEEAESLCRALLAAAPKHAEARLLLTALLLGRGRLAEAEALTAEAMTDHAGHPEWLNLRGVALVRLGRRDEALACFDQAIERRLLFPTAHANLLTLLAERRDPTPRFKVSLITSTIGSPHLTQTIESVQAQTYPFVEHILVADGPDCHERVRACLPRQPRHPVHLLALPFNVGGGGYCGHRSYAAVTFLVNGRYVGFLDDDNWLEADHVASLMAKITAEGLAWAYSLRKIVDAEGRFIAHDDCESLGLWPTWYNSNIHLVDVNCYLLRRDVAVTTSAAFAMRKTRTSFCAGNCSRIIRAAVPAAATRSTTEREIPPTR
jgi:tetratricopeptide (TPR) repeat protein